MSDIQRRTEIQAGDQLETFEEELLTHEELVSMLKWGIEENEAKLVSGELDPEAAEILRARTKRMGFMLAAEEEKVPARHEPLDELTDGRNALERLAKYHNEQADFAEAQRQLFLGGEVLSLSGSGFFDPNDPWVVETAETFAKLREDHLKLRNSLLAKLSL